VSVRAGGRDVEGVAVDDVAEAAVDLWPDAVRAADDGEGVQHGVVDPTADVAVHSH
jgi:hypothetical protein